MDVSFLEETRPIRSCLTRTPLTASSLQPGLVGPVRKSWSSVSNSWLFMPEGSRTGNEVSVYPGGIDSASHQSLCGQSACGTAFIVVLLFSWDGLVVVRLGLFLTR